MKDRLLGTFDSCSACGFGLADDTIFLFMAFYLRLQVSRLSNTLSKSPDPGKGSRSQSRWSGLIWAAPSLAASVEMCLKKYCKRAIERGVIACLGAGLWRCYGTK